jgi:hypothetical protein
MPNDGLPDWAWLAGPSNILAVDGEVDTAHEGSILTDESDQVANGIDDRNVERKAVV